MCIRDRPSVDPEFQRVVTSHSPADGGVGEGCFQGMRNFRGMVSLALLAGLVFGTGCETDHPKPAAASIPAQAKAPEVAGPVAQPADPKPKVQPQANNPKPDPAEALIAQAEKQYAAGQANYRADHLEAAKQNFDQAFNTLLSS